MNNKSKINEDTEVIKKTSKKKLVIISAIVLLVTIMAVALVIMINSRNKAEMKDENIKYLISTYGNISVNIISKKKNKTIYNICSKKTPFCTTANYYTKTKKWSYPKGEGFVYTIVFLDQAIKTLESNNIDYTTYVDSDTPFDIPNNFILVIKKENESSLIDAIIEIDNNDLIASLCTSNNDEKCTGKFEIDIFNTEEYNTITKKYKKPYGITNYVTLYEYLYKVDDAPYGIKPGKNIERHDINNNMFSCNDEYCNKCKHIAYRYVIGNHNHVNNTIIVEGIN